IKKYIIHKEERVQKMKLVSYMCRNEKYRMGCIIDGKVADLQEGLANALKADGDKDSLRWIDDLFPADPDRFYFRGMEAMEKAERAYNYIVHHKQEIALFLMDDVTIGTPVPHPSKIIFVGNN